MQIIHSALSKILTILHQHYYIFCRMKTSSVATALSFASVFITSVFGVRIEWRVILDCGSSGTRARLYNYDADITPSDRIISEYTPSNKVDRDALTVKPGIATFVGKAGGVNAYLAPLVNQAARWVPPHLAIVDYDLCLQHCRYAIL